MKNNESENRTQKNQGKTHEEVTQEGKKKEVTDPNNPQAAQHKDNSLKDGEETQEYGSSRGQFGTGHNPSYADGSQGESGTRSTKEADLNGITDGRDAIDDRPSRTESRGQEGSSHHASNTSHQTDAEVLDAEDADAEQNEEEETDETLDSGTTGRRTENENGNAGK